MGIGMAQLGLRHALARLRGKQIEIARRQERAKQQLANAQAELAELDAAESATNEEVAQLSQALALVFADPATSVEPRQTFPKRHLGGWGSLTRAILDIFRGANGGPLLATEVTQQLQVALGLELDTAEKQAQFRRHIGRTLKNMKWAGHLEGLHDPSKGSEGVWRLKVML